MRKGHCMRRKVFFTEGSFLNYLKIKHSVFVLYGAREAMHIALHTILQLPEAYFCVK